MSTYDKDDTASLSTLVNADAIGTPHYIVSFTRDNMKNTHLLSSDGQILYSVATDKVSNMHTVIRRRDTDEIVAEVDRKNFFPDSIQFGAGDKMKLSEWLHGANGKWSDL